MTEYAERDIEQQGEHYTKHVSAMTGEDLHSKSAIAAELAHRDIEIERLTLKLGRAQDDINQWRETSNHQDERIAELQFRLGKIYRIAMSDQLPDAAKLGDIIDETDEFRDRAAEEPGTLEDFVEDMGAPAVQERVVNPESDTSPVVSHESGDQDTQGARVVESQEPSMISESDDKILDFARTNAVAWGGSYVELADRLESLLVESSPCPGHAHGQHAWSIPDSSGLLECCWCGSTKTTQERVSEEQVTDEQT